MILKFIAGLAADFLRGWLKDKRHEELIRRDAINTVKLDQANSLAKARKAVSNRSVDASRRRVSARAKRQSL